MELDELFADAENIAFFADQNDQMPNLRIDHFQEAIERRAPQTGTKSRVNMDDVGGLEEAKQHLIEALGELVGLSCAKTNIKIKFLS